MSRRAGFTQSDLTRALKGAHAAGLQVQRVEIRPGGMIVIVPGAGELAGSDEANPWDGVLHDDPDPKRPT